MLAPASHSHPLHSTDQCLQRLYHPAEHQQQDETHAGQHRSQHTNHQQADLSDPLRDRLIIDLIRHLPACTVRLVHIDYPAVFLIQPVKKDRPVRAGQTNTDILIQRKRLIDLIRIQQKHQFSQFHRHARLVVDRIYEGQRILFTSRTTIIKRISVCKPGGRVCLHQSAKDRLSWQMPISVYRLQYLSPIVDHKDVLYDTAVDHLVFFQPSLHIQNLRIIYITAFLLLSLQEVLDRIVKCDISRIHRNLLQIIDLLPAHVSAHILFLIQKRILYHGLHIGINKPAGAQHTDCHRD